MIKRQKPGRPPTVYNQEEIENIVKKFREDNKITGKATWGGVHLYAKDLFEQGIIKYKLSEDFWRKPNRQGTLAINSVNEVVEDTVDDDDESEKTVNTFDAVNKLFTGKEKDKKELINKLTINEAKAKQFIKKNKRLDIQVKKLEEEILRLTEQRDKQLEKATELQLLLFKFMEYSKKKSFPVENIFNTGNTRTGPVDLLLSTMFGENPTIGFDFNQYLNEKENSKVVEFKSKQQKSAHDEYGSF